jgi:hypothetical protein
MRKLAMLARAQSQEDLRIPPANRFEALKAAAKDSTAFGSTISFGRASRGRTATPTTWKSSTTTDVPPN